MINSFSAAAVLCCSLQAEAESVEGGGPTVTEADIANITAQWTGIPIEKVGVLLCPAQLVSGKYSFLPWCLNNQHGALQVNHPDTLTLICLGHVLTNFTQKLREFLPKMKGWNKKPSVEMLIAFASLKRKGVI